jgi:hypothetical protein
MSKTRKTYRKSKTQKRKARTNRRKQRGGIAGLNNAIAKRKIITNATAITYEGNGTNPIAHLQVNPYY